MPTRGACPQRTAGPLAGTYPTSQAASRWAGGWYPLWPLSSTARWGGSLLPPHWVVPPSGGAAWGRRRAETHEAAHRRGFRGVKRRARRIFASREAIGCVIRSSACCNPQQRCRASTAPASQRVSPTPTLTRTSRRDRGRTAAESGHVLSSLLGCAAASMSSATHAQRRLSTSNGGPSRPGEASPAGSRCTRAPTAATAARASTAAAAAAAAAAATAATGCLTTGGDGRLAVRAA